MAGPRPRRPGRGRPRQLAAASSYLPGVQAALPKLATLPALIVWGTKDFAFQDEARERFERTFPDHRTVLLADASHFVQEDAKERIVQEFKAFRRSQP